MWKGAPLARRRNVLRAIRSGELLRDPEDAELLLRITPSMRRSTSRLRRPVRLATRLAMIAWLGWDVGYGLFAHGGGGAPPSALVFPALYLVFDVYLFIQMRGALPRVERAEALHREYLHALGHALPVETPRTDVDESLRREIVVAYGLLTANFLLFIAVESLPVFRNHGSSVRLVDYVLTGVMAIAFASAAALIGVRSWRRASGFERRSQPGLVVFLGSASALAWAYGLFCALFGGG